MKKKKSGGGANWMDTYGDMVTLLLCFFVLLYSMSTISEENWRAIVMSFNPNAKLTETNPEGFGGPNAEDVGGEGEVAGPSQEEIDKKMDELFQTLSNYVAQEGAQSSISVTKGGGYVFVSFNEAVFFDPNRYALREEGEVVLDQVASILSKASDAIDEVEILGHTAQASPNQPNETIADRFLASNRATNVVIYLQDHSTLDPARLISVGYGQWRPAAENDTSAGRAQNRRVEMVVTGLNLEDELGDSLDRYNVERTGDLDMTQSGSRPSAEGE